MDKLTLKGLRFHAPHGYYEEERIEGNDFEVDLVFYADLSEAGRSDDLSQTIDYQKAETAVKNIMEGTSVKLIETLTLRIGEQVFETFPNLQKLEVSVRKMEPPIETKAEYSEVQMTWTR
ncbi:dihydroneopterin aldolase [Balneolaceae bacterium YR4-1]|uniref:7,8-dihydroneopterin aldolase n=1 Tax=Halalkalibaculum roseum TaxID=2709311 RepID=A0A6M1T868_9BACT|nr:dihydroneopterin aldolase [Halalkalibaculum roseum]NGP78105.1 dihydroneopterin aldolase [Halalkalibaculum roseum]